MDTGLMWLDDRAVSALLPRIDVPAALREMFLALARGQAVQPAQSLSLFPGNAGDAICYQGVLANERVFGVKVSPFIAAPGGSFVTAWTLLMSMETGLPVCLCDSKRLTTERTAGTTALALDLLASASASHLCVLGAGPAAQAHVRHVLGLRPWASIRVHSPRIGSLSQDATRAWTAIDSRISLHSGVADATRDADVLMLCTSSATPVIDPATLRRPALFTSIGTNAPGAHEVPPASLASMDVYCDHRLTTPPFAAEMRLAVEQEGWTFEAIRGDLPGLVSGTSPLPQGDRHAFFRSIGLGLEDVVIANRIRLAHQLDLHTKAAA